MSPESSPKPVYNFEKDRKLRDLLGETQHKVILRDNDGFEETQKLQDELIKKVTELKDKYPDAYRYSMFHILGGSTMAAPALHEDFPGDDSVEKFLNDLVKRYE